MQGWCHLFASGHHKHELDVNKKDEASTYYTVQTQKAELQTCETHWYFVAKKHELDARRTITLRDGLMARCRSLWLSMGKHWGVAGNGANSVPGTSTHPRQCRR